ncbi:MAG: DUF4332 domain-containing protein [Chloroflexi bacterium]|nr:DUF4332 domain-containing protein [Chloroflexota bacterium]
MTSFIFSISSLSILQNSDSGNFMWYFLLVLVVLLLLLLWWIWWQPSPESEQQDTVQEQPSSPPSQPSISVPDRPGPSTVPLSPKATPASEFESSAPAEMPDLKETGSGDDLTRIEGIGPKIAGILQDAGITTYSQLAASEVNELQAILTGKARIFFPDTWPEQAKLAAKGDWEALKQLQAGLKGGRRQ